MGSNFQGEGWQDLQILAGFLEISYENLYKMVRVPDCTVSDCWEEGGWFVDFRRTLSVQELNSWHELLEELMGVSLQEETSDSVFWALEKNKQFSTGSLYRFLTNRGMTSRVAGIIWKCKIPLKIKFFLWQVFNNKLEVAQSLLKRGWKGSGNCCLCGKPETIDHIFFDSFLAKLIWSIILEVFRWKRLPSSLMDFTTTWLQGKGPLPL